MGPSHSAAGKHRAGNHQAGSHQAGSCIGSGWQAGTFQTGRQVVSHIAAGKQ